MGPQGGTQTGGGQGALAASISAQVGNSDTLSNSTANEQFFVTNYLIRAGTLITNKVLRATLIIEGSSSATAPPSFTFRVYLCQTAAPFSGTKVNIYVSPGVAPSASATTNLGGGGQFIIQGTAAAGSAVTVESGLLGGVFNNATNGMRNTVSGAQTINTSVDEYLAFSIQYANTTNSGNNLTIRQLIVEPIN